MTKFSFSNIHLSCMLQQANEITPNQCLVGVISRTDDGFRFEESIRKGRAPRNPKLFDGQYISMVRKQNGRYQCHLKTMKDGFDKETFAQSVYAEICNALKILE